MGKSYAAMKIGEMVDPTFDVSHVTFTVKELLKLVNSDAPQGSVFVFDDAGLAAGSREWYSTASKIFGWVSQSIRYKNFIIVITVPSARFIESQSRDLITLHLISSNRKGQFVPYIPYKPPVLDSSQRQAILLNEFPRVVLNGKLVKVRRLSFPLPSPDLVKAYEDAKAAYLGRKYTTYIKRLEARDDEG